MKSLFIFLKEWIPIIVIALVLSFIIKTYFIQAVSVPTESMVPTIQINDHLLVEKISNPKNLGVGEIVVFYPPFDAEVPYVKRLIGTGGDTIEIKDGYLFRNGEKIKEPYLNGSINYNFGPIEVPVGKYFFLGDNRNNSNDAHLWNKPFVDETEIIGKIILTYYPFKNFSFQ